MSIPIIGSYLLWQQKILERVRFTGRLPANPSSKNSGIRTGASPRYISEENYEEIVNVARSYGWVARHCLERPRIPCRVRKNMITVRLRLPLYSRYRHLS